MIDQKRRASISIMSNIAEGFERGSNTEFIQYLFIAKGSCGEVRAQLTIASDQKYIDDKTYEYLYDLYRIINKMLSNFISYLKRSNYKGTKYKNQPA